MYHISATKGLVSFVSKETSPTKAFKVMCGFMKSNYDEIIIWDTIGYRIAIIDDKHCQMVTLISLQPIEPATVYTERWN